MGVCSSERAPIIFCEGARRAADFGGEGFDLFVERVVGAEGSRHTNILRRFPHGAKLHMQTMTGKSNRASHSSAYFHPSTACRLGVGAGRN
jgi:hypothetical protein